MVVDDLSPQYFPELAARLHLRLAIDLRGAGAVAAMLNGRDRTLRIGAPRPTRARVLQ